MHLPSAGSPHPVPPHTLDARLALTPVAHSQRRVVALPGDDPLSARTARRAVRYQLAAWDVYEELADDLVLVASELTGNAVSHSITRPRVQVKRLWIVIGRYPGAVLVAVVDNGSYHPWRIRAQTPDTTASGGRGLHIVAKLSDRWGHLAHPQGTCVWAARDLGEPGARTETGTETGAATAARNFTGSIQDASCPRSPS